MSQIETGSKKVRGMAGPSIGDPSGLCMSEDDLPTRLEKYGGSHIVLKRVALLREHCDDLPSFPAAEKSDDPRHNWFVRNFGHQWELDALDPNDLRDLVEKGIKAEIERVAWERCAVAQRAEQDSLRHVLDHWGSAP
jgi:hypothetical protein